ncbi:MAG: hypothetical protein FWC77_02635 [Defluviitaleaceae bacterium]|nr:hypothetical protein [Defluviitaleaceae bacterium]
MNNAKIENIIGNALSAIIAPIFAYGSMLAVLSATLLIFAGCTSSAVPIMGIETLPVPVLEADTYQYDSDTHHIICDATPNEDEEYMFCDAAPHQGESTPPQEQYPHPETISLLLGDTLLFKDIEATLGNKIEFVSYENGQYLYIPIVIKDLIDRPHYLNTNLWQLMDAVYYKPFDVYPNWTRWHSPGCDEIHSAFLMRSVDAYAKTHIRLSYNADGVYTLQFNLREDGWNTAIIKVFELSLNIVWPEDYKTIVIENIPGRMGEPFRIGNFQAVIESDFLLDSDELQTIGIHLFPATLTNIGSEPECLSSLEFARLNCNSGYPMPISRLYFEGDYIPLSKMPVLYPGTQVDFHIPVEAFVCENTAWYRSFRLTERIADYGNNHITVRHYYFDIYVRGSWQ